MVPYYQGNVAFDQARVNLEDRLQELAVEKWENSQEAQLARQQEQAQLVEQEKNVEVYQLRNRSLLARRLKILAWVSVISLFTFIFAGLMIRQATIFEQNFQNTSMRLAIKNKQEENNDLKNNLISKSDTAYIESQALHLFSLRKPSQLQRQVVDLPESDQVIFYEENNATGEQRKSKNYQVLEAYMKMISQQAKEESGEAKVFNQETP